jgi:F-type H+-transporting ATPase subunit b
VRAAAADAAARAAEQVLRGQMTGKAGADMLSKSLNDIKGKLN